MSRLASFVCPAVMCLLLTASGVHADPIRIVAGGFTWSADEHGVTGAGIGINLRGQQGFRFEGVTEFGLFSLDQCVTPDCAVGTTVDLEVRWTGKDLLGSAAFRGRTYDEVGQVGLGAQMDAGWTGSLTIPPDFTSGLLTAPFLFSGAFSFPPRGNGDLTPLDLVGRGTATLAFEPFPGKPGIFLIESARFEFDGAPVPEPSTLMLVGLGGAAVARIRARRRSKDCNSA